ncbi:hypothetical protein ACP4OV_026834 [Aristida adscensionis]
MPSTPSFFENKEHQPPMPFNFKGFIDRLGNLFARIRANHQINNVFKDVMNKAKNISERHDRYKKFDGVVSRPLMLTVDPRLEAMYRKTTELVGIGGPKDELAKRLMEQESSPKQQPMIISVVGCGGLGKTTLANALFHDLKRKFDCNAFVSVSLNPDIKNVLKNLLGQLDEETCARMREVSDVTQLINKTRKFLENRRSLCVIDDVWKESAWDTIKLALQDAKHVSGKIIKKCGGVPLPIITISSLLASKARNLQEWEKVNNSGLDNSLDVEKMRKILSLSYYDLLPHLKSCLLSLSKYPEDTVIRRDVLVWSWIAEGFITHEGQPAGTILQDVGDSCFIELINRSLIQPVHIGRITEQYGQVHGCRVHDMVLDLINRFSAEEGFMTTLLSEDGEQAGTSTAQNKIRRLSIHNGIYGYADAHDNFPLLQGKERTDLSKVRSLNIFSSQFMPELKFFQVLRCLQLEDCSLLNDSYFHNLQKFHLLRFLQLGRLSEDVSEIPESIGQLRSLETLDIRGALSGKFILLPNSFVNLRQLVRLISDGVMLREGMGEMKSLRELVGIYISWKTVKEIENLTELRVLRIVGSCNDEREYILRILQRCSNLQELDLSYRGSYSIDFIQDVPSSLQRFTSKCVFQNAFPGWINASLSMLTVLSLRLQRFPVLPQHLEKLAELPRLRFLRLGIIGSTKRQQKLTVHNGPNAFRWLRDFHFYSTSFFFLTFQPGAMPKLQRLYLSFNEDAANDFDFGLENLHSLHSVFLHSEEGKRADHLKAQAAIRQALQDNPNHPTFDMLEFDVFRSPY